jgi:hypothetical protein
MARYLELRLSGYAVYLINAFEHTAYTVHQFGAADSVLDITETEIDVIFIVTADVNMKTSTATKGSARIYKLNMTAWESVS